ncbi:hypothetical protein Q9966_009446 [Columba livia]|nr:hypothetical protein Q9966_009446 [Columba livia]
MSVWLGRDTSQCPTAALPAGSGNSRWHHPASMTHRRVFVLHVSSSGSAVASPTLGCTACPRWHQTGFAPSTSLPCSSAPWGSRECLGKGLGADGALCDAGRDEPCSGLAFRGADLRLELVVGWHLGGCTGLGAWLAHVFYCPK